MNVNPLNQFSDNQTEVPFFRAGGGTMRPDDPSYTARRADEELYEGLRRGDFCYVLDSRQVGKSSLMVRNAVRLRAAGDVVVILDLSAGSKDNVTPDQWYAGLLTKLSEELRHANLDLEDDFDAFWETHVGLAPMQRWMAAIETVVLMHVVDRRIVLFIDEIDVVRSLPFPVDEFFTGIRECYNRRARNPEFERLTFCLLGVATPGDLVRDPHTTPFNIGQRIELHDFTAAEIVPLAQGMKSLSASAALPVLARVHYWTGGHPYLTQVLCRTVANDSTVTGPAGVDRHCEQLFLSEGARERDDNLLFVRERVLRTEVDLASLLSLYKEVRARRRFYHDETDPLLNALQLAGITRLVEGYLWVRNRIYFRAFDQDWIRANMPGAEVRRQRAAFRRGAWRAGTIAAALIVVLLCSIWFYLDSWVWERTSYYNTFAKRFGIPQGIHPLTLEQMSHKALSYRFVTRGRRGPLMRMDVVNGAGENSPKNSVGSYLKLALEEPQSENQLGRECQWEYVYDTNGRVIYEKARDRFGRMVWGLIYSPAEQEAVKGDNATAATNAQISNAARHVAKAQYVGSDGYSQPPRSSRAEYAEITYNALGDEELIHYKDRNGNGMPGPEKAYGVRQRFDGRGLIVRTESLGVDDQPITNGTGAYATEFAYDADGNELRQTNFDVRNHRTFAKNRWSSGKAIFDVYGNKVEEDFEGVNDQPTMSGDLIARWVAKYDKAGNQIEQTYYDASGGRTLSTEGVSRWTATYDNHERQCGQNFYGTDDRPTLANDCTAGWASKYDEAGNRIETIYRGLDGRPIQHKDWGARTVSKYDAEGHRVEQSFFGEDGRPLLCRGGYARVSNRYDLRGRVTEVTYYGIDGKPSLNAEWVARYTDRYDERGNIIEEAKFGVDGQPTLDKDGVARATAKFDDNGNRTEQIAYGIDGQVKAAKTGVARLTATYDEHDNVLERAFYDENDELMSGENNVARIKSKFDSRGNETEKCFYDANDQLVPGDHGISRLTMQYDERDNVIEQACYGADAELILNSEGAARWTCKYDERGNKIETSIFGLDGEPVLDNDGYTRATSTFDIRGNRVEASFYGLDGNLVLHKHGYARVTDKFDARNNPIEEIYYGVDGELILDDENVARWTNTYDARGNIVDEAYFDVDGQPIRSVNGVVHRTAKFDMRGNKSEECWFGSDGKPELVKGFARQVLKYDERGNQIDQAFFGLNGEPVLVEGVLRWTATNDERGNQSEFVYRDAAGRPAIREGLTYAKILRKFDYDNRISEESYFDAEDRAVLCASGYAMAKISYDAKGNRFLDACFDESGRQMVQRLEVEEVERGGTAARAGVLPGDIILTCDEISVVGLDELEAATSSSGRRSRKLGILRAGKIKALALSPGNLKISVRNRWTAELAKPQTGSVSTP